MEHSITPSPELVRQWHDSWYQLKVKHIGSHEHIATQAARWGANQELEACCQYIGSDGKWFANPEHRLAELRATRRPKPPSLAEQALEACDRSAYGIPGDRDIIRAALERLQELEKGNE